MKKLLLLSLLPVCGLMGQTTYQQAAKTTDADLAKALNELTVLRNEIADKKIPLARKINELEDEVISLKAERDEVVELQTGTDRIRKDLENQAQGLKEQSDYILTAVDNYLNEFIGNGVSIGEKQLYEETIQKALSSVDNSEIPLKERYQSQVTALETAFDRMEESVGGYNFTGKCKLSSGSIESGNYAVLGPLTFFTTMDGSLSGLVRIDSQDSMPIQVFIESLDQKGMKEITTLGSTDSLPMDVSDGLQAIEILKLDETLLEHIKKGGTVMYPILGLFAAAILVSIYKLISLLMVPKASPKDLEQILGYLRSGQKEQAMTYASKLKGPVGQMLREAVENVDADEDLVEEILYENMLRSQPKLESMLAFISVTAATAPLLGLLGTVTGMIKTFKLITIFGTGDAASLASGISEALITTEYGLIVAIPSLLFHAFLSRMAKGVLGSMERTAVGFINGLPNK